MEVRKLKLLMVSDDPDTILSYGILSRYLIEKLWKQYEIHYLSLQYPIGNPIKVRNDKGEIMYVKYPAHNQGQRNPKNLPNVIKQVQPDMIWTNFDVQHYMNVKPMIPTQLLWLGWIPWDNHDPMQAGRAMEGFSNVDARIAISKFGQDWLNEHGVECQDHIYNIVDTDVFYPLAEDDPQRKVFKQMNQWYSDDLQVLLFVGRPNWRKRMIYMLSILKELLDRGNKNIRLFLHTSLHDPASEVPLDKVIDAFGLNQYVITTDFQWDQGVPQEQLRLIYNMADIYIAPHAGEGFGMPIVEAMACGTPFVASDICTTREFAGDNERGLPSEVVWPTLPNGQPILDKGVHRSNPDVKKFADKIESLLRDKNRRKAMGENGVMWARKNCSCVAVASKWAKLIETYNIPVALQQGFKE